MIPVGKKYYGLLYNRLCNVRAFEDSLQDKVTCMRLKMEIGYREKTTEDSPRMIKMNKLGQKLEELRITKDDDSWIQSGKRTIENRNREGVYEREVEGALVTALRLLTSCKASETACRARTCCFHASLARFARITNNTLFTAPRNLTLEDLLNEFGDGREGAPTA